LFAIKIQLLRNEIQALRDEIRRARRLAFSTQHHNLRARSLFGSAGAQILCRRTKGGFCQKNTPFFSAFMEIVLPLQKEKTVC
jgi:hypothetical protein